jgi:eukaryotic-like serine/threonine-protein kinase
MLFELGRYQFLEKIGEGAMAKVIKAYDPQINRLLAIKILKKQFSSTEADRERFLREANAAGTLSHPGIVTIYDIGEEKGGPYIAMELLPERTLEDFLQSTPILNAKQFTEIALQIVSSLNYAHQKGIIHRDLKPSNIMFGDNDQIKLMDFGIAHNEFIEGLAQDKDKIMGTPEYISPEQLKGQEVDARSDIFSLGVIFYQMLCRYLPYKGPSTKDYFQQIMRGDIIPLKAKFNAPASLEPLIMQMLHTEPMDRPQSVREVFEILKSIYQEIIREEQIQAQKSITPIRFSWTAAMALVVAITMTVSALIVYQKQYSSMADMVFDYGSSLANMLAVESAESLLIEDTPSLDSMIKDVVINKDLHYVEVRNHLGKVVSTSLKSSLQSEVLDKQRKLIAKRGDTSIALLKELDEISVYAFTTPIYYRDKLIGEIRMGLSREPLNKAAHTTMILMLSFMLVTIFAVFCAAYYLTYQLSKPLSLMQRGIDKLIQGNFENRIPISRQDEFGQLFKSYNALAAKLKKAKLSKSRRQ